MMLGAYTTWLTQQWLPVNWSLPVAVPLAFLVAALVGIAIERGVIRFLYGRPLETLLATFGVSLILQQAVRSIFSPLNRSVATPDWMSGTIALGPLEVTLNRLIIIGFCFAVFGLLWLALQLSLIHICQRMGSVPATVAGNRLTVARLGERRAFPSRSHRFRHRPATAPTLSRAALVALPHRLCSRKRDRPSRSCLLYTSRCV